MGENKIPSFKELDVWKKAMRLMGRVCEITLGYPPDERFGLVAETRKTARSVPANIAEGKMRISAKEYRHFISIALGSAGELHTQILAAHQLGYLTGGVLDGVEKDILEVGLERALDKCSRP